MAAQAAAKELATLVRGRVLRTNVQHRPFPSVLNFPGLNTAPWWDTAYVWYAASVLQDLSSNPALFSEEFRGLSLSRTILKAFGRNMTT